MKRICPEVFSMDSENLSVLEDDMPEDVLDAAQEARDAVQFQL